MGTENPIEEQDAMWFVFNLPEKGEYNNQYVTDFFSSVGEIRNIKTCFKNNISDSYMVTPKHHPVPVMELVSKLALKHHLPWILCLSKVDRLRHRVASLYWVNINSWTQAGEMKEVGISESLDSDFWIAVENKVYVIK